MLFPIKQGQKRVVLTLVSAPYCCYRKGAKGVPILGGEEGDEERGKEKVKRKNCPYKGTYLLMLIKELQTRPPSPRRKTPSTIWENFQHLSQHEKDFWSPPLSGSLYSLDLLGQ